MITYYERPTQLILIFCIITGTKALKELKEQKRKKKLESIQKIENVEENLLAD